MAKRARKDPLRPSLWAVWAGRIAAVCLIANITVLSTPAARAASNPASGDLSAICDRVSSIAAAQSGVPISVLKAISLTETGRKRGGVMRPWPWTVNMEGKGMWFDSQAEARAYVDQNFARGARSFDVGCFQINYKWHYQEFDSLDAMFDPLTNALYAAKYLKELFVEKGNWTDAAGAYHSRTPKFANRYKERFSRYRARLLGEDAMPLQFAAIPTAQSGAAASPQPRRLVPRVNTFPLLQTGIGNVAMGSLVPLGGPSGASSLLATAQGSG